MPWLRLLVVSVAVMAAVSAGAGRACSWWPVAAATALTQSVLHTVLSSSNGPVPAPHGEIHSGAGAGYAAHHSTVVVLAVHLLTAVSVAVLMHRADHRLSSLPHDVGRWGGSLVVAVATAVGRGGLTPRPLRLPLNGPPLVTYRQSAARAVLSHVLIRRGPPEGRVRDVPLNPADRARRA